MDVVRWGRSACRWYMTGCRCGTTSSWDSSHWSSCSGCPRRFFGGSFRGDAACRHRSIRASSSSTYNERSMRGTRRRASHVRTSKRVSGMACSSKLGQLIRSSFYSRDLIDRSSTCAGRMTLSNGNGTSAERSTCTRSSSIVVSQSARCVGGWSCPVDGPMGNGTPTRSRPTHRIGRSG